MNAQDFLDGIEFEEPRDSASDWAGAFFPNLSEVRI